MKSIRTPGDVLSAEQKAPMSGAAKWTIGILSLIIAGFILSGPALDSLAERQLIVEYGSCEGLEECFVQSSDASKVVYARVSEDVADDCIIAHQIVSVRLSQGEQFYKARTGSCLVSGSVLNDKLEASYWVAPWVEVNDVVVPPVEQPVPVPVPESAPESDFMSDKDCFNPQSILEELTCKYGNK